MDNATAQQAATAVDALATPEYGLSPDDARLAAIAEFIGAIADEVKGLTKGGTHDTQGWTFIQYDDIYAVLRPLLKEHRVRLVPTSSSAAYEQVGKFRICTLTVMYMLITPVGSMPMEITAEGADLSDKATTKAWTYAKKTAYTQLFDLAVDKDPDASGGPNYDLAAEKIKGVLGRRIDEAHKLADARSVAGLRGMHRSTKSLHDEPVQVAVWWNDTETRTTTFGQYLEELGRRIRQAVEG